MQEESTIAYSEIIGKIKSGQIKNKQQLEKQKAELAKKYGLLKLPKNAEFIEFANDSEISSILKTKPVRTLSGIANISVMWLPEDYKDSCPAKCVYCPQGISVPKSYTGTEPTTMRATMFHFDPHLQVSNRLRQFHILGHQTDKCELIIMGGTFMAWQKKNRENFIKRCFDAFNGCESLSLEEAQKINETAANRCVGLTIETRADFCKPQDMLYLGCTRAEIGVQSTDDNILKMIKRGHNAQKNKDTFAALREAGLKVCAHWMPGLTGLYGKIDIEKEIHSFKELFENPDYKPDELKIYPVWVIEDTELYEMWKRGEYEALTAEKAAELIIELKKLVPKYVRIKKMMRDISHHQVMSGPAVTNLRQLIKMDMKKRGLKCMCIRCREAGLLKKESNMEPQDIDLQVIEYQAGGGKEFFLSFEDAKQNILMGFLRLRVDESMTTKIRELHVYGEMVPIGNKGSIQHSGYGKRLLAKAEELAREAGKSKMQVTSGIGVRNYYRKLGYEKEGFYMVKNL